MTLREPGQPEPVVGYGDIGEAITKAEYDRLDRSDPRPWPERSINIGPLLAALTDDPDRSWIDRAACHPSHRPADMTPAEWTGLFFPLRGYSGRQGRKICDSCEVRGDCAEYSQTSLREKFGTWGGQTENHRKRARVGFPSGGTRPGPSRRDVERLTAEGVNPYEIARRVGVPYRTVIDWQAA